MLFLQFQIILFDQLQKLSDLIGLCFPLVALKIEEFAHAGSLEYYGARRCFGPIESRMLRPASRNRRSESSWRPTALSEATCACSLLFPRPLLHGANLLRRQSVEIVEELVDLPVVRSQTPPRVAPASLAQRLRKR